MNQSEDYLLRCHELYDLSLLHIVAKVLHLATQLEFDKII
jgi:hypothetical protein